MRQNLNMIQQLTAILPRRKNVALAVLLQCIPLLGAVSCTLRGVTDQHETQFSTLLWCGVLLWGLGYAYLGAIIRFLGTFVGGAIYSGVCWLIIASLPPFASSIESGISEQAVDDANRLSYLLAFLIALPVVITAADAWRLANRYNAGPDAPGRAATPDA